MIVNSLRWSIWGDPRLRMQIRRDNDVIGKCSSYCSIHRVTLWKYLGRWRSRVTAFQLYLNYPKPALGSRFIEDSEHPFPRINCAFKPLALPAIVAHEFPLTRQDRPYSEEEVLGSKDGSSVD